MRILSLTDVLFPDTIGGAGRVAYHLSHELGLRGHTVNIITRNPGGKLESYQRLNANLYIHRFYTPFRESISLFLFEIINSSQILKQISKEQKFDIVCIHQSMAAIGPLVFRLFKGIPIIHYYHSPWHEEFLIKKSLKQKTLRLKEKLVGSCMRWIEKQMLLKSSGIIVLSHYMRNKLVKIHNGFKDKIAIIPGGVDLDSFTLSEKNKTGAKQLKGFPNDRTLFLTIRNLVPRMGIDNLIEAFNNSETLRKKSLLLIGGSGFLENQLKSKVTEYKLSDNIHFRGHIPDNKLSQFYQAVDFFVLPTEKLEGFGLVILESMACGTPVIGTPVGAIPELIGAFDKRLLTKGTTSGDIKDKLEEVITNYESYYYNPEDCRKFVVDNYSWKKMADDFEKVALELIM